MRNLPRLFRTIRHLKLTQVLGRLWLRFYRPFPDLRPAPQRGTLSDCWICHASRPASLIGPMRFRFLNVEQTISVNTDWQTVTDDPLWLYNLHYFDDLNASGQNQRAPWQREAICRWISDHRPHSAPGWDPYPTSLRIVNWIKWIAQIESRPADASPDEEFSALIESMVTSLAIQARSLLRRLETHLLGNHLLANAKALVFAGLFFSGPEADRWLARGVRILRRQLAEQILPDGGHFELSPMYHSVILEDLLDLYNLLGGFDQDAQPVAESLSELKTTLAVSIPRMLKWLDTMSHPDQRIAFFNDGAFGIAIESAELNDYARRLDLLGPQSNDPSSSEGVTHLTDSGYVRCQTRDAVLLLDVARIGPDYLPGHAHADTLSFEMSLFGKRLFVNSGTSGYGGLPVQERLRQRGTAAHNTVVVNGENSSEVWAGFRVGSRAYPSDLSIVKNLVETFEIGCSHDGYCRFSTGLTHRRTWHVSNQRIEIVDELGAECDSAVAVFHVHPLANVVLGSPQSGQLPRKVTIDLEGHEIFLEAEDAVLAIERTTFHPEFGLAIENWRIVGRFEGPRAAFSITWPHGEAS